MKNIAVLSTMYYPDMGAPSACIDKYVQRLKEDYNFHIITKTDETGFAESEEYDIRYIKGRLHSIRKWCFNNIKHNKQKLLSRFVLLCVNLIKFIQTQFSFPTAQEWETNAYLQELENLHQEYSLCAIIAVSNTFVTQLATLKFKKKYPDVKWIAFITDPYSESYIYYRYKLFRKFWKNLNLRKEQEIYDKCDYALFTPEMYKYIPTAFNIDNKKIFKIEFILDRNVRKSNNDAHSRIDSDECRLIYAGLFYKAIRNPEFALSVLSNINHISVDMFVGKGECEEILDKYISPRIRRFEYVEYSRYLQMINSEYDILINVGNNATLQAPSKMLELLSTGKPIINFYHTKDSQFDMIERYPLGINIGKEDKESIKKIDEFCRSMKGKQLTFDEVEKIYPDNNLEKQVEQLRNLIEA